MCPNLSTCSNNYISIEKRNDSKQIRNIMQTLTMHLVYIHVFMMALPSFHPYRYRLTHSDRVGNIAYYLPAHCEKTDT